MTYKGFKEGDWVTYSVTAPLVGYERGGGEDGFLYPEGYKKLPFLKYAEEQGYKVTKGHPPLPTEPGLYRVDAVMSGHHGATMSLDKDGYWWLFDNEANTLDAVNKSSVQYFLPLTPYVIKEDN